MSIMMISICIFVFQVLNMKNLNSQYSEVLPFIPTLNFLKLNLHFMYMGFKTVSYVFLLQALIGMPVYEAIRTTAHRVIYHALFGIIMKNAEALLNFFFLTSMAFLVSGCQFLIAFPVYRSQLMPCLVVLDEKSMVMLIEIYQIGLDFSPISLHVDCCLLVSL